MIKDKRNIDILFEEGLKGFREKPPVYAWDRMDKSLDKAKFKKSMVYLRWMAASVLIILAFGAGYYFAVFNLNIPEIASDTNETITNPINTESPTLLVEEGTKSNFTEASNSKATKKNNDQLNNTILSEQDNEILANNDYTFNNNNQFIESENLNSLATTNLNDPNEVIGTMQFISISNIPLSHQSMISLQANKHTPVENTEIAVTEFAPMSLYYYPEDYNLKPSNTELETKWAVGAQFAPVISYRNINSNNVDMQTNVFAKDESQHNNAEDALLSYAGGVDVNYHVSKRWSIQSGLYFSRIGQENNDALNFKQNDSHYQLYSINTSTGNANLAIEKVPENIRSGELTKDTLDPINIGNVKIIQNFDLFEIPVLVRYKVLDKRFGINLSGGLSPAYLAKSQTYLETENNKHDIGNSENLNPMIINTTFALGLNYGITKKLTINFEPTFKYSLSPINNNSGFDYHPYYFSWYTGIRYNF